VSLAESWTWRCPGWTGWTCAACCAPRGARCPSWCWRMPRAPDGVSGRPGVVTGTTSAAQGTG